MLVEIEKQHNNMIVSENFKFWSTLIIGIIGALAWFPFILEQFEKQKIEGKILSSYNNVTKNKKQIYFLFKLSVVSINKDFLLKDIDLKIRFKSSSVLVSTSRNNRIVIFNIDGSFKRLNVTDNQFLNNLSILKKNSPEVGYLFFAVDYDKDEPIVQLDFVFTSYNAENQKILRFTDKEIKEEKLLFDDSIWTDVDINSPELKRMIIK